MVCSLGTHYLMMACLGAIFIILNYRNRYLESELQPNIVLGHLEGVNLRHEVGAREGSEEHEELI